MTKKKKRNTIIASLCAIVLLMTVGYAAFSTSLNIKGTSNISSNWNIKITDVTSKNVIGAASNNGNPTFGGLSATFKTNLQSPGDSIEYEITVSNEGNVKAKLDKYTLTDANNPVIKFTQTGLTSKEVLNAGATKVFTVKVEYLSSVTSQPSNVSSNLSITLDYSQADAGYKPSDPTASEQLVSNLVTSGDGLYVDNYENGRYVYKGASPNNYITFNNELWRIISVEADGKLKLIKNESIGDMPWDTSNSNNWARPATLSVYLNETYYNGLSDESKGQIVEGEYKVGALAADEQNLTNTINFEGTKVWNGNIALATVSEYVRASTNSFCTSAEAYWNNSSCYSNGKAHNWMTLIMNSSENSWSWLISPSVASSYAVFYVHAKEYLYRATANIDNRGVEPVLHLKSDIKLTGEGTISNPYTIS